MSILLDTHILIWFVNGNKEITKSMQNKINDSIKEGDLYLASITLWEIAMLNNKGRIHLQMPYLTWIKQALDLTKANVIEMTPEIIYDSCNLSDKFHNDPADRLIVSTAREIGATILTKDKQIIQYSKTGNVLVG